MKISEIKTTRKDFLTAADIAEAIGCDAQAIRVQATRDPRALGFPVMKTGKRTRIPREGFIRWYEGRN